MSCVRKLLGGLLLLLGLFHGAAQAQQQVLEAQPEFDVGDRWTYKFTDIAGHKAPVSWVHQAFKSDGGSGWIYGEALDPSALRKAYIVRYDYKRGDIKEGFSFNPANPLRPGKRYSNSMPADDKIRFPLSVGKEYTLREDYPNGNGWSEYDVTVKAFERVKVEAGEFDAFKIVFSGWWTRTDKGNVYRGSSDYTYWYAPEAKRVVKTEYADRDSGKNTFNQSTSELVKWEPRAPLASALENPVIPAAVEASKP